MKRRLHILGVAVVLAVCGCASMTKAVRHPNVILISADDMGSECLRSYGGTSYDSALLDRLAERGMRFTHCYSQPICTPSRVKLMTGRSNARNYRNFGMLAPEETTFGTIMKGAGYRTGIAGKWQLSGGSEQTGVDPHECGFDQSCMWAYLHNLPEGVQHIGGWEKVDVKPSRYWHPCIVQNGNYRPTNADDYGPDLFTEFVLDFIERQLAGPFFVYYPMALTHDPFLPTPHSADLATADRFTSNAAYFGDMIAYTGHCVDRIVRKLDELGIAEDTLVLFTTDNGTHRSVVSRMGARIVVGGKGLPIDAGCRVPLIAYWKGTIQPGSVCHDLVDFSDFLPTIAELGGANLPADKVLDGQSFLPQLRGEPGNPREAVVVHYDKDPQQEKPQFRRVRFAANGTLKLYDDGRLYDVASDPDERQPLDHAKLTVARRAARNRLHAALQSLPAWNPDNRGFGDGQDRHTTRRQALLDQLQAADAQRPNFLIFMADDQYRPTIGCYGASPSYTPNIDRLASEGLRFTRCFTQSSICTPNRGAFLSGMVPLKNGAHANHSGFADGVRSLPNYMRDLGYRACLFNKDGIRKPSDIYEWEFSFRESTKPLPGASDPPSRRHLQTDFDAMEKILTAEDPRPFCILHATRLPHAPYLGELANGLSGYDASNHMADAEFGRALALLEKHDLADSTVVVYVNDNESHGRRTKYTLYDSGLNVACVVRWPGQIESGRVSDALIGFHDFLPTLVELAGGAADPRWDGRSMLDLWRGNTDRHREELYLSYTGVTVGSRRNEIPYPIRGIRTQRYKYLRYLNHTVGHPLRDGAMHQREELFDLKADPREQTNVADSAALEEVKRRLSQKVDAWMQSTGDGGIESELETLRRYPPQQARTIVEQEKAKAID